MKDRIKNEIMNRIRNNGGIWCEVAMKRTGEHVHIGRLGLSSFEALELDRFTVAVHGTIIANNIKAEEIANYILTLA